MNELDLQKHLCDTAITDGGFAFKMSNQYMVGVSDLSVSLLHHQHCFVEVKYAKSLSRVGKQQFVLVDLTPHQRRFLYRVHVAGGSAGWVQAVSLNQQGRVAFYASSDLALCTKYRVVFDDTWIVRERGESWPIEQIVNRIQTP